MILQATHTHLYPGLRGSIAGVAAIADLRPDRECVVEFTDGSAAAAGISKAGDDWHLHVNAYRTAAGTAIADKRWVIRLDEDGGQLKFRILGKVSRD